MACISILQSPSHNNQLSQLQQDHIKENKDREYNEKLKNAQLENLKAKTLVLEKVIRYKYHLYYRSQKYLRSSYFARQL